MCDLLHPEDLAYWWDHPGMLVLLENVSMPATFRSTASTMTVYIGDSRMDAYQSAASFHYDMSELLLEVAAGHTCVSYWSWNVASQAWGFKLQKFTKHQKTLLRQVHS